MTKQEVIHPVRTNVVKRAKHWLNEYPCIQCGKLSLKRHGDAQKNKTCISCNQKVHGIAKTPIYKVWCNIRSRCNNTQCRNYYRYGGRGIRVCQEWNDPKVFHDWAISNGYKKGLQIDRINNDGDYEPGNCRFVTLVENCRNRSTSKLTHGDVHAIRMLCWSNVSHIKVAKIFGVVPQTVNDIMKFKKWSNI